ncbi:translocator protein [Bicyclus anynana]|uniref:Translocator protein n=1 Tax=Bicyclus anynana TaxID=110368 RepID=A0A6J1NH44_BICAN|nr:translocator protein [Bicyclus anynana]
MVLNWQMVGAMVLPNIGGWAGALSMIGEVTSADGNAWYERLRKPTWTPPNWVFGPTWVILYTAMGYASYLIYEDCGGFTDEAVIPLGLYGVQLLLNWFWTPVFFKLHQMGWAFLQMCILDGVTMACIASFFDINKMAAAYMVPYLGWLAFASCLNYSFWMMNREDIEKMPLK